MRGRNANPFFACETDYNSENAQKIAELRTAALAAFFKLITSNNPEPFQICLATMKTCPYIACLFYGFTAQNWSSQEKKKPILLLKDITFFCCCCWKRRRGWLSCYQKKTIAFDFNQSGFLIKKKMMRMYTVRSNCKAKSLCLLYLYAKFQRFDVVINAIYADIKRN